MEDPVGLIMTILTAVDQAQVAQDDGLAPPFPRLAVEGQRSIVMRAGLVDVPESQATSPRLQRARASAWRSPAWRARTRARGVWRWAWS
nr:hypothetical protein GCM10020093_082640 [Planobispora longispora]